MKNHVMSLALSTLLAVPALATVTVDAYQDMECGSAGDILTNQPQATGHGSGGTWNVVGNTMRVATNHTMPLTGAVIVEGTMYCGLNDTRSWMTDDNTQQQYVVFRSSAPHDRGTMGLYLTVGIHARNPTNSDQPKLTTVDVSKGEIYDAVIIGSGPEALIDRYVVCQIYDAAGGPYLEIEANPGNVTRHGSPIQIKADTTYWVTLRYDGVGGLASLAVYNPTNWTQLGSTTLTQINGTFGWISFGREDHHYNGPATHSYFDNILIDYTSAVFPLLPGTNSPVPLSIARLTNGCMELTLTSQVGRSYRIEASTNLAGWTAVYSNLAASTTLRFTDTNSSTLCSRFYRAFVQ